ncbi:hypothetical protein BHE74_00006389 [Ensete ventricosum]|uniref:Uncharacterized protein n=1 Tax=Ensete ventricosum TaxID=4639 RepID=A0A444C5R9_ENSVE|nr:hypothetical protein B296_00035118 [Ensete ventricosum]RWV81277.1 hypothetical protein GW17_00057320 [Ensete ventricosum]RWW84970.1 hypothetical protein BHE74_00006389 [Ensete ventricosum]RZR82413.1 hypothetical protein BHM03_00008822 [Ensete ventricosum]
MVPVAPPTRKLHSTKAAVLFRGGRGRTHHMHLLSCEEQQQLEEEEEGETSLLLRISSFLPPLHHFELLPWGRCNANKQRSQGSNIFGGVLDKSWPSILDSPTPPPQKHQVREQPTSPPLTLIPCLTQEKEKEQKKATGVHKQEDSNSAKMELIIVLLPPKDVGSCES